MVIVHPLGDVSILLLALEDPEWRQYMSLRYDVKEVPLSHVSRGAHHPRHAVHLDRAIAGGSRIHEMVLLVLSRCGCWYW